MRVRFAILERVAGEDGGSVTSDGGFWGSVSRACWRRDIECSIPSCSEGLQPVNFVR